MLLRTQVATSWIVMALGVCADIAAAHHGHQATTYEVTAADHSVGTAKHLRLNITVGSGDERIAARFTVVVDGESYVHTFKPSMRSSESDVWWTNASGKCW